MLAGNFIFFVGRPCFTGTSLWVGKAPFFEHAQPLLESSYAGSHDPHKKFDHGIGLITIRLVVYGQNFGRDMGNKLYDLFPQPEQQF